MNISLDRLHNDASDIPTLLILFSRPKCGKTTTLANLTGNYIIDLENSTSNIKEFTGINIKKESLLQGKSKLAILKEVFDQLKVLKPQRITIDSVSELEEWLKDYATILYKRSPMGAKFEGKSIWTDLKDGRIAWDFLRKAWDEVLGWADGCCETLILVGHLKDSTVVKDDEVINVLDIKIQGAQKTLLAGRASAMGYMYRDPKTNINYLDFGISQHNIATGSRLSHLANKKFKISELNTEGNLTTNWDDIFIHTKNNNI